MPCIILLFPLFLFIPFVISYGFFFEVHPLRFASFNFRLMVLADKLISLLSSIVWIRFINYLDSSFFLYYVLCTCFVFIWNTVSSKNVCLNTGRRTAVLEFLIVKENKFLFEIHTKIDDVDTKIKNLNYILIHLETGIP